MNSFEISNLHLFNSTLTANGKNANPTRKLAVQLMHTARALAVGLAAWLNNSDTKNHGMEPGPQANMITYTKTKITQSIPSA